MLKFIIPPTVFTFFLLLGTTGFAQNGQYDLRFTVNDCTADQIFVDIEIKANSPSNLFELADQNYRISFSRDAVDNPFIAEELEVSGLLTIPQGYALYGDHNMNGSSDTIISYNVELLNDDGLLLSATDWTGVGRIGFDILDQNECLELEWHRTGIFPPIFVGQMYNDSLFSAVEGVLEDLDVCFADLSCVDGEPPVANDDNVETDAGVSITFNIVNNDTPPAGESINTSSVTLQSVLPGGQGTLINNDDGTLTFYPAAGFVGLIGASYEVCATNGLCDIADISITVTGESPVANNDFITAATGASITFNVVDNDTAPVGESLENTSVELLGTLPTNQGVLVNNGNGTLTFTPANGFIGGANPINYKVCATNGLCDQALIVLNVVAESPTANDDNIIVYEDTALTFSVVANDVAPAGSNLNNSSVGILTTIPGTQGSLLNNGNGTITFTPAAGFSGNVNPIDYQICATNGLCAQGTIFITVYERPTAFSDFINVVQDEISTFSVVANDSAPAGSTLDLSSVVLLSNIPSNEGTLINNGDGTFSLIPAFEFYGGITPVTYEICTDVGACAQAIIVITVLQKPTAVNDTLTTEGFITIDILSNDIAPIGSALNSGTITLLNSPPASQGILVNNFDGTVLFAPALNFVGAVEPVNYRVCAASGTCGEAIIYITVVLSPTVAISGTILDRDGTSPIEDVTVSLSGSTTESTLSDGTYAFGGLASGGDYTITPTKEGLLTDEVNAIDVAIAQAYILDLYELTVYDVIAMDVNEDCALNAIDLAITQSAILGILADFPHGKTWKFVPADLTFPNMDMPCNYDEFLSYEMLETVSTGQDFIGVKAGDVNASYDPAGFTAGQPLYFSIADRQAAPGELISIPVRASGINDILTWQLTHSWDASILEFQGVEWMNGDIETGLNFNETLAEAGYLTSLWLNPQNLPITLSDNTVLYELKFKVMGEVGMSAEIATNSLLTPSLACDADYGQIEVLSENGLLEIVSLTDIQYISDKSAVKLLQNTPNPFSHQTSINFYIPHAGRAKVLIYNMLGKKIWKIENNFSAGHHGIIWDEGSHYPAGIYTCELQFENEILVKKMLIMK